MDKRGILGTVVGTLLSVVVAVIIIAFLDIIIPAVSLAVLGLGGMLALFAGVLALVIGLAHFFGFFYYFSREQEFDETAQEYGLEQVEERGGEED